MHDQQKGEATQVRFASFLARSGMNND